MSSSTISFDGPLAEFARKAEMNLQTAVRLVSLDIMTRVVERTPVRSGRARSGWDLTIGHPSDYLPAEPPETPGAKADKDRKFQSVFTGGASTVNPAEASKIDGKQAVYIMNNLPYIERLENGWSEQAPSGMVRLSLDEVSAEIEILLEGIKE